MPLTDLELEQLREAKRLLESPSLAARLTDLLGKPIEMSIEMLPERAVQSIHEIVRSALVRAQDLALTTIDPSRARVPSNRLHKWMTAATGAVGGLFGMAGLAVELPVTTVIMLRSIADIARGEGHDLSRPKVRLACLEVFALGGRSQADDAAETGYYAIRAGLAKLVSDAAQHMAQRGVARGSGPALVKLLERIAARFGLVVEEKVALEMIPAIGAISGALVNTLFMDHFQNVARGHFVIKRLEAQHGLETVRNAYRNVTVMS